LAAGVLIDMVGFLRLECEGAGANFFVTVFERLGFIETVVFERTGGSFLTVLAPEESRFDIDFCLTGERGEGPFGSSFAVVTHQLPAFFSCILTGCILRESIFPM
jgi:hypothetical protein